MTIDFDFDPSIVGAPRTARIGNITLVTAGAKAKVFVGDVEVEGVTSIEVSQDLNGLTRVNLEVLVSHAVIETGEAAVESLARPVPPPKDPPKQVPGDAVKRVKRVKRRGK